MPADDLTTQDPEDSQAESAASAAPLADADAAPGDLNAYWPVSLCFWCTLLLAAGAYGAVAVAPKLAVWNSVRHQYQQNARELQRLEEEVDYLERVETALQTDPEFLQRLKQPTAATAPGEQSIAISGDLLFGYETMLPAATSPPAGDPPGHGLISALAGKRPLRRGLLIFAAGLTVFAFTFLNDAGVGLVASSGRIVRAAATLPLRRYVRVANRIDERGVDQSDPAVSEQTTDDPSS